MDYSSQVGGNNLNVTTSIDTFFCDDSSLQLSCWNKRISFKWSPAASNPDFRGNRVYVTDTKLPNGAVITALPQKKLAAIIAIYESDRNGIKTAYESGGEPTPDMNFSIELNERRQTKESRNFMRLSYESIDGKPPAMYLSFVQTDMESGSLLREILYRFDDTISYPSSSDRGVNIGLGEVIHSEFNYFMNILKNQVLMLGLVNHHAKYAKALGGRPDGFITGTMTYDRKGQPHANFLQNTQQQNNDSGSSGFDQFNVDEIPFN